MKQETSIRESGANLRALILAIVVGLLAFVAVPVVLAYVDGPVQVGDYRIALLSYDETVDLTLWTYQIGVSGSDPNALSHLLLGIGDCYGIEMSSSYTTPEDVTYEVTQGYDGSTGYSGLKFDYKSGGALGDSTVMTHTFVIPVPKPIIGTGEIDVVAKYGGTYEVGSIMGPICDPTAVKVTSLNARSGAQSPLLALALAFGGVVAAGAAVHELRKND